MSQLFFGLAVSSFLSLMACQIETKHADEKNDSTLVDPKYSLTQDRSEFEKLRESIPENKRKANDEKALIAEWMNGTRISPADIREKYDNLARKKREIFNKDMTQLREQTSKAEKKNREIFLKELENERTDFSKRKRDREERADFYSQLDEKRRNYFAEEREKRDEFESNVRDQRKNFEDYLKEKYLNFSSELKSYTESWNALKKNHD